MLIYKRGTGWVEEDTAYIKITWGKYMTYKYDKCVCIHCKGTLNNDHYFENDIAHCRSNSRVGEFLPIR